MTSLLTASLSKGEKKEVALNKKKKKKVFSFTIDKDEEEEEQNLTSMLFGTTTVDKKASNRQDDNNIENEPLFVVDRESSSARETNHKDEDESDSHDDDYGYGEKDYFHDKDDDSDQEHNTKKKSSSKQKKKKEEVPVWKDEDDGDDDSVELLQNQRARKLRKKRDETKISSSEYKKRQREHFERNVSSNTDWAITANNKKQKQVVALKDSNEITAEKLLSSSAPLTMVGSAKDIPLPPSQIDILRCKDVNLVSEKFATSGTCSSVQFYPYGPISSSGNSFQNGFVDSEHEKELILTAGYDKKLSFYEISKNGNQSKLLQSFHFQSMPIYSAAFVSSNNKVLVSGKRPYFYIYDTNKGQVDKVPYLGTEKSLADFSISQNDGKVAFHGNDGKILLWDIHTKHLTHTLKINGTLRCTTFSDDGQRVIASGSDGDVYTFDLRYGETKCIDRFHNEDGTITRSLAASSNILAVGAESGVVNLYDNQKQSSRNYTRSPMKSLMHLRTICTGLKMNHTGEILAMSSTWEKDAFKLCHLPTQTLFANWPSSKTPLGRVWSMDFSHNSKYLAMGNDKGKCLLYRLKHYSAQ